MVFVLRPPLLLVFSWPPIWGIPVSTTHVITGAISGVGSATRFSAVRWGVTFRIVWAWIFTIPASAILAGLIYSLCRIVGLN